MPRDEVKSVEVFDLAWGVWTALVLVLFWTMLSDALEGGADLAGAIFRACYRPVVRWERFQLASLSVTRARLKINL